MTPITFPVPAIKFGKSDAELILCAVEHLLDGYLADDEERLDLEAIEDALEEFLA